MKRISVNYLFHRVFCLTAGLFFALSVYTNGQTLDLQSNFDVAPTFLTGPDAYDTTVADLDGDGNLDVIASNNGIGAILTILYGTNDGAFASPVIFPTGGVYASQIDAGDVNNDGKPDVVFTTTYGSRIGVILNQGNRQLAAPLITTPPTPAGGSVSFYDVAIGDFDGDGQKDLVALLNQPFNRKVRFFHIGGQGGLAEFSGFDINEPENADGTMFVGDVNGDNLTDVVMSRGGSYSIPRNISFIFGRTDGNLSFTFGFNIENKPVGASIGDLDGDGDRDLLFAFNDLGGDIQHSVQPYKNNGNGNFTPAAPIKFVSQFTPNDVATGDFNNDGIIDLAAVIYGETIMLGYGNGDLTYGDFEHYAISYASKIFPGDFDHDNKPDLLTASVSVTDFNRISVVLNDNFRGFKAPRALLWGTNYTDAADFNGDGYPDLISASGSQYAGATIEMSLNDYASGNIFQPETSFPTTPGLVGLRAGDFNGDGKKDVAAVYRNARRLGIYFGNGAGGLSSPVYTTFTGWLENLSVGDFNRDGKDDVLVLDDTDKGYVMLSAGDGTFTIAANSPFNVGSYLLNFQTGDFNGDLQPDIISESRIYLGDGTGRFVTSPVALPNMRQAAVGDFNRDGNLDIVGVGNGSDSGSSLIGIFGDGDGGVLTTVSQPFLGSMSDTESIAAADYDLDGYPDIALSMHYEDPSGLNELGNLVIFYSGGATSSWKSPLYYRIGLAGRKLFAKDFNLDGKIDLGYIGYKSRGAFLNTAVRKKTANFDFDGDGKTDVGVFRPSDGSWWYSRSSDNAFRVYGFGTSTDILTPGDYTGDGKTDIAVFRPSTGEWFIRRSDDNSFFSFPFGAAGDIPTPADFDGDGKTDVAVFRPASATWFILNSNGSGTSIVNFGAAEDKPVPADFDGDGKTDIAIFRPSDGSWWYLRSSDSQFRVFRFGLSTDKPVQGDWTGDGKADIAVFRPTTGEWFVQRSEDNSYYSVPFGTNGDVPVPGDYDGDGKFDTAVFRPSTTNWFVQRSKAGILITAFGATGDRPLPNVFVP